MSGLRFILILTSVSRSVVPLGSVLLVFWFRAVDLQIQRRNGKDFSVICANIQSSGLNPSTKSSYTVQRNEKCRKM